MTETLANGYSSESTQQEHSNEYQHDRVEMVFKKSLRSCALDESRLSIGRVNMHELHKTVYRPTQPISDFSLQV